MFRFALKIEYDGGPFCGWQTQIGTASVQDRLERAIGRLDAQFLGNRVFAAGRTDAGVHALGQVVHCDLARDWDPFRLGEALNYYLKPDPVAVLAAARVDGAWHARFSAVERQYIFRIFARRAPSAHHGGRVWQIRTGLDLAAMQAGAVYLKGHHDFTTFRSTMCQAASPVKTLNQLDITADANDGGIFYNFDIRARSFLHNQVRSIVGTLERVGAGRWPPERIGEALRAADRSACGPVAPPSGLYLAKVQYPLCPFSGEATQNQARENLINPSDNAGRNLSWRKL